jgi:hypothetical protein
MSEETILEQLHREHPIDEMVKFSDLDLQEKLADNPYMIVKYRELYYKELAELDNLEMLMDKLTGMRYKYYRFEDDKEWSKPEIEKYCLPSDSEIIKMTKIINRQKIRVRFFEMAYKGFEKMQWSMKSFIDTLKGGY